jgi:hypothetical protein
MQRLRPNPSGPPNLLLDRDTEEQWEEVLSVAYTADE